MEDSVRKRLNNITSLALSGALGNETKKVAERYRDMPTGYESTLEIIKDLYVAQSDAAEDQQLFNIKRMLIYQLFKCYSVLKTNDPSTAKAFANSLIEDHPQVSDSCALPQWDSLTQAIMAFKQVCRSTYPIVWNATLQMIRASFEFYNKILGYLILSLAFEQGRRLSVNILQNAFGAKTDLFRQLTSANADTYKILLMLSNNNLRNSIAHGDIIHHTDTNDVTYKDTRTDSEYSMNIGEFVAIGNLGVELGQAYIIALGSILVLENGGAAHTQALPKDLRVTL